MSPEQIQGSSDINSQTDVFSMGVMLYQVLYNQLPFDSDRFADLCRKILEEDPIFPEADYQNFVDIKAICHKAMEKDAKHRYQTTEQLAQDLGKYLIGEETRASYSKILALYRRVSRKNSFRFAIIAMLLALVVLISMIFFVPESQPQITTMNRKQKKQAINSAVKLFNKRQYDKSLRTIKNILAHDDKFYKALWLESRIYDVQGHNERMRLTWARLLELSPSQTILIKMTDRALAKGYISDANGFLQKALKKKSVKKKKNGELLKCLLQIQLYTQKNRRAYKTVLKLKKMKINTFNVKLQLAEVLYRQRNFERAEKELTVLENKKKSTLEQAKFEFLQAKIEWQLLQKDLNLWQWLFPQDDEKKQTQILTAHLDDVKNLLMQADESIAKVKNKKHYAYLSLNQSLLLYKRALEIENAYEVALEESKVGEFKAQIAKASLLEQVLFRQVVLRFMLRHKQWQQAEGYGRECARQFPWIANFHHLYGLAIAQQNRWQKSRIHHLKSIYLDRWESFSSLNMINLAMDDLTQKKFYYIFTLQNHQNAPQAVDHLLLNYYLQQARERHWQNFSDLVNENNISKEMLLEALFNGSSEFARNLAVETLAKNYRQLQLLPNWANLKKSYPKKEQHTYLKKLESKINKIKRQESLSEVKKILLRYSALEDTVYAMQLIKKDYDVDKTLMAIIESNDQIPVIRYLAARMLLKLGSYKNLNYLLDKEENGEFPVNILAMSALQEKRLQLPKVSYEKIKKSEKNLEKVQNSFYRFLIAYYIDPHHLANYFKRLLNDSDPQVSLCAAYRLKAYKKVPADISWEDIYPRIYQFVEDEKSPHRTLACRILWDTSKFPIDIGHQNFRQRRSRKGFSRSNTMMNFKRHGASRKLFAKIWGEYAHSLIEFLDSDEFPLQLAALQSIADNREVAAELSTKFGKQKEWRQLEEKLLQFVYNNNYLIALWSANTLSYFSSNSLWKIVKDSKLSFSLRLSLLIGVMSNPNHHDKDFSYELISILKKRSRNNADLKLKQSIVMVWSIVRPTPGMYNMREKNFRFRAMERMHRYVYNKMVKACLRSKERQLQDACLASMLWSTERSTKILEKYWKDTQDLKRLKIIAGSLIGVNLFQETKVINKLLRKLKKHEKFNLFAGEIEWAADSWLHKKLFQNLKEDFRKDPIMEQLRIQKKFEKIYKTKWQPSIDKIVALVSNYQVLYKAAFANYKANKYAQTLEMLKKAERDLQSEEQQLRIIHTAEINVLRAQVYWQQNQKQKALNLLKQTIKDYPFAAKAHYCLAKFSESPVTATQSAWQAYIHSPQDFDIASYVAVCYAREGKKQQAQKFLQMLYKYKFNRHVPPKKYREKHKEIESIKE